MTKMDFVAEPGRQEVITTQVFDAPRELVFKMFTDPGRIPQWWGPRNLTTVVDRMELKPGGIWRFVQRDAEGNVFAFHGIFHLVVPPERIIQTFEFEGMPGHVLLETMTLEDLDGRTKMTQQSVYQAVSDRDGMVSMGMMQGNAESMERLSELLVKGAGK